MPELPELEAISHYLNKKLSGNIIADVQTYKQTVIGNIVYDDVYFSSPRCEMKQDAI